MPDSPDQVPADSGNASGSLLGTGTTEACSEDRLPVWRSPAFYAGAGCWLVAVMWLAGRGFGGAVTGAVVLALLIALLCGATAWLTNAPPAEDVSPKTRRRLAVQLGWTLLLVGITLYEGIAFHREPSHWAAVPLWSDLVDLVGRWGKSSGLADWLGSPIYPHLAVVNPFRYCLIPLLWLVPWTGFRFLGLGRGRNVAAVAALWLALPLAWIGWQLASGSLAWSPLGRRLLSNAVQNGFGEEFLFRGVLQTRVRILGGVPLSLVGTALLFGIWHVGFGMRQTGTHNLLDALASTIVWQATIGFGLGYIYHRTGNLLASSLLHTVANST